jgi:hypothetical protein
MASEFFGAQQRVDEIDENGERYDAAEQIVEHRVRSWIRLQPRANRGITEHQAETGQAQHQHQDVQHCSFSWVSPAIGGRRKWRVLRPGGRARARPQKRPSPDMKSRGSGPRIDIRQMWWRGVWHKNLIKTDGGGSPLTSRAILSPGRGPHAWARPGGLRRRLAAE